MRKKTTRIIAFIVCVVVIVASTIAINAGETYTLLSDGSKLYIKADTNEKKVVRVENTGGMNYNIAYNKKTEQLSIAEYKPNLLGIGAFAEELVKTNTIDLKTYKTAKSEIEWERSNVGQIIASGSEAWSNYAYRVRKLIPKNRWWLKTSERQKVVYETTSNIVNLRGFMTAVDTMDTKQTQIAASCSGTLISAIAGCVSACFATGVLAPVGAVVAALVALGAGIGSAYLGYDILKARKTAEYYYDCV